MNLVKNIFETVCVSFIVFFILIVNKAEAHVSERALVLLLPTEFYIPAGLSVLILTIFISYITPISFISSIFLPYEITKVYSSNKTTLFLENTLKTITSLISFFLLFLLILAGIYGSRDPLDNPLPLFIWTVWFMMMPIIQILVGNFWSYANPWYGIAKIIFKGKSIYRYPSKFIFFPPSIGFLLFALFMLVYIAPDDPDRLAIVVMIYWGLNFFLIRVFGFQWLEKGECFSVFYNLLSKLSCFWIENGKLFVGLFGSQLRNINNLPVSSVLFLSIILATLSFDGLNETFWWFSVIDVNPLEFYGRSSVYTENTLGLILFVMFLLIIFSLTIFVGHFILEENINFRDIIGINAISLLPIALAYHIAHYLTSFIVNIQYAYKVSSDPFGMGSDYFNFGNYNVTTSFFNTIDSVKLIWLVQASSIVAGHVLAILLAHSISSNYLKTKKSVLISQFPISLFMVGYTFLGLWILSSPTVG